MVEPVIIGECVLYCCDALTLLPTIQADCLVTDPPYGISWTRGVNAARRSKRHDGILNDQDTSARDAAVELCKGMPGIVFGSFYAPFPRHLKQVCVWHKPADSGLVGSVTGLRRDVEPIFLVGKWPQVTCDRSSVFRSFEGQSGTVTKTGHPHTKPVRLMKELLAIIKGETVLDPFMGSGATALACIQTGRRFIGCEIDPAYFDIAVERIREAQHEGAGSLFASRNAPDLFTEADK